MRNGGVIKFFASNFFKKKINFTLNSSLEAQIASISDDIAYNSHDLEDGLKSNLFNLNHLTDIPVLNKIISKHKKKLWQKGETSGNKLNIINIYTDCDSDTLIFEVELEGDGACHTGSKSCFYKKLEL